jgi:hypothetical protein
LERSGVSYRFDGSVNAHWWMTPYKNAERSRASASYERLWIEQLVCEISYEHGNAPLMKEAKDSQILPVPRVHRRPVRPSKKTAGPSPDGFAMEFVSVNHRKMFVGTWSRTHTCLSLRYVDLFKSRRFCRAPSFIWPTHTHAAPSHHDSGTPLR